MQASLDPPEQVLRAQRVAAVRERDHYAEVGAEEALQLVLGLGEPPRGDRGTLRLERELLPARKWLEARGRCQRLLLAERLEPGLTNGVRSPDEVGRRGERRCE